ncbi:MAG: hypothetical protein ACKPCM_11720, partial [Pseudanabaena sp.]
TRLICVSPIFDKKQKEVIEKRFYYLFHLSKIAILSKMDGKLYSKDNHLNDYSLLRLGLVQKYFLVLSKPTNLQMI